MKYYKVIIHAWRSVFTTFLVCEEHVKKYLPIEKYEEENDVYCYYKESKSNFCEECTSEVKHEMF